MDPRITLATRVQQPVLIALWGASSSGKTYSALQLAYGLIGNSQLIGMIDTENRRGKAHVGTIPVGYYHFDLAPPYSADKYIDAFKAFENEPRFGCVIIDSYTHVWDGEGGATEQAMKSTNRGLSVWLSPKTELKRLVNVLLRSRMHVILCMREKMSCGQDNNGPNGKMRVFDTGYVPITEKNTIFEMGVSFWLGMDHKPIFRQPSEKCFAHERIPMVKAPPAIMQQLKDGEYLSIRHGQLIAEWYRGDSRDLADEGKQAASRGTDCLKAWSASLKEDERKILPAMKLGLKDIAAKADAEEAERLSIIERERVEQEAKQNDQSINDSGNAFLDQFTPTADATGMAVAAGGKSPEMGGAPQDHDPFASVAAKKAQTALPKSEPAPVATNPPLVDERAQKIAKFNRDIETVDWFYQMADDGEAFKRGKQGVDALSRLAVSLGPEFTVRFEGKLKEVNRRVSPQTPAPTPAPTTMPSSSDDDTDNMF